MSDIRIEVKDAAGETKHEGDWWNPGWYVFENQVLYSGQLALAGSRAMILRAIAVVAPGGRLEIGLAE